ncbi:MAG: 50S ribosomal protein L19e [Thaumarchaeota archaeon]|nr:50S ribosomal protein L19e [Nitrososphaerota archaeon]
MVVNLRTKKSLISRVTNVGVNRIKLNVEHLDEVTDAITRENVRGLITANKIKIIPTKGTSRLRSKIKKLQKNKRGTKTGSKKGRSNARFNSKKKYVEKVRSLRYRLKVSKKHGDITNKVFWKIYKKIQGNRVRNNAHLRELLNEEMEKE